MRAERGDWTVYSRSGKRAKKRRIEAVLLNRTEKEANATVARFVQANPGGTYWVRRKVVRFEETES